MLIEIEEEKRLVKGLAEQFRKDNPHIEGNPFIEEEPMTINEFRIEHRGKQYASVKEMCEAMDREEEEDKKKRPIMHRVENAYWWCYRFIRDHTYSSVKWFFKWDLPHRLKWGCSERDLWALDYTTSKWILKRLKALRSVTIEDHCGYPGEFYDFEDDFFLTQDEKDAIGLKKWQDILDKIIRAFELLIEENSSQRVWDTLDYNKEKDRQYEEGMELFVKYFRWLST